MPTHQVFIVLTPGLRADDLTDPLCPALRLLRGEGAAGWMVCRAARTADHRLLTPDGRDTPASLALTLGSGARALADENGSSFLPSSFLPSSFLPSSFLPSLRDLNHSIDHAVPIGALGDLIHRGGWKTALLGSAPMENKDSADSTLEAGGLLAMDGTGQIDFAPSAFHAKNSNISNNSINSKEAYKFNSVYKGVADVSAPYGMRDDVPALLKAAMGLDARFALVVIAFGDLARADRYGPLCLPAQSARHRANALRALNQLVFGLRQQLAHRQKSVRLKDTGRANGIPAWPISRLYLLSPAPAASVDTDDRIAPVCVWGDGISPGILTSPSTRTSGIVVNTDFLPAVAADLGVPIPSGAVGRPFAVQVTQGAENTAETWKRRHDRLLLSERLKNVYGGLPTGQTLLVLAAVWAFRKHKHRLAGALAIVIVALPLGMLLLPFAPFASGSVLGAGLTLAAFAALFAVLAWRAYPHPRRLRGLLLTLCCVLTAAIVLDLLTGSHLLRAAWMSYAVMETARFYGIGNEYMGVVIGAACILLGAGYKAHADAETRHKIQVNANAASTYILYLVPCLFSLFLLFILGYNRFGAKVGAIPSAGCALGVELLMLWRGKLRMRDAGAVVIGAGLLLSVLILLDMRHAAGEQSHLARAFAGGGRQCCRHCAAQTGAGRLAAAAQPVEFGSALRVGRFLDGKQRGKKEEKRKRRGPPGSTHFFFPSFLPSVSCLLWVGDGRDSVAAVQ